jgi:acetyl esterase/lipase
MRCLNPMTHPTACTTTHLDLRYADTSARQVLDLYLPDTAPPPNGHPLIVHIHGGAWRVGDKRDSQLNSPHQMVAQGYALAAINYRLSGEAQFPAQIHDVKAAIRWLRGHASAYRLDPQRVAAWGGSAGGHLSALVGTSAGVAALEDLTLGHPTQRSDVQAVVSWFGPTDFLKMDVYLRQTGCGTPDHGAPTSPESQLLGAPIAEVPDAVRRANPESWLRPDCPPFLLQHGTRDHLVPYQHSVRLADRIDEVAGPGRARLTLLEGARHGGAAFESAENLAVVSAFLREHLVSPGG